MFRQNIFSNVGKNLNKVLDLKWNRHMLWYIQIKIHLFKNEENLKLYMHH